ncbi:MAG: ABC transporter ATP-binding protein, partial [Bacteroidota bacterium]
MKEPVLTGEALAIGYPAKPQPKVILKNLHLELRAGELVALLGPNGVGKSTLLRTLAGLQAPLQGKVLLKGEPIQEYSPLERARELSLVLTEPVQAGNLRVRELVSLGRFPHTRWAGKLGAQDVAKVEEAIAACRIEYLADSRVFEISDGQRQKAMIARALAQDGLVMLLDEPTAHLDLPNKGEIMHLLHGLAHEFGKAILVSTHDLQLALQMADRLMLADCVEALETGTPEDLMLAGRVAHLFDHPQFQLDTFTGQYRLRREEGKPIAISGPATAKHWLTVALEKQGYLV